MRIILDLQACQAGNRHRGIGRYSMSLALAIARQAGAHDLRIVLNSSFPESVPLIRAAFDGLLPQSHIAVFDVPHPAAEIAPANAWRARAAERVREAYLASFKPDIVHVASLFEGLVDDAVASIGLQNTTVPTAATLYDLIPLLRKNDYLQDPRVRDWYYRKLQSVKNANLLLAISAHTRSEAIDSLYLPPEQVVNISGAADDIFRPLDLSGEQITMLKHRYGLTRPFVMYTGGIDSRKNIEGLIAAFAQLPLHLRNTYQLAVVCKTDEVNKHRLLELAAQSGLGAQDVVFTGYVCDDDLVSLYNMCALFVFPSLHEGFGLPALEAMSCGAAVIGSNSSSIPEVIGYDGALFNATDSQEIARKIYQALSDNVFRNALKTHGVTQARRFSWQASARTAISAFENVYQTRQGRCTAHVSKAPRLRLAYLSPLPPAKSGIADYSAELLPELVRYYDIDVITDQETITDPMVVASFTRRSVDWFDTHADEYDRIVYHFGNSSFHQHMFELLERHPGVVVLHDFFLSGVIAHMDGQRIRPYAFPVALYRSHGYIALLEDKVGRGGAIWNYPCNKEVLNRATGVITHSQYAKKLAEKWYDSNSIRDWQIIPLLRAFPPQVDRAGARRRLGIAPDDFVVCSFGILGPTKLNDRLLGTWLASPLAASSHCHLIFVGHNDANPYCRDMAAELARTQGHYGKRVRITGFVTPEEYRDYLSAADIAVQLRSLSRGETSASILDCLAYGVPTIINANGAAEELPDQVLVKLPDEFDNAALIEALTHLWRNAEYRASLSRNAMEFVQRTHHPAHVGQMYYNAIEEFAANSVNAGYRAVISSIATLTANTAPTAQDLQDMASCIASNRPGEYVRQMFVDISELVQRDARSGIQRVVRNILNVLLKAPPAGYRIEPVYEKNGTYLYAREFTLRMLDLPRIPVEDDPIEANPQDMFIGLDLNPAKTPDNEQLFVYLRNRGVELYFVVYDLLPVLRPDVFVAGAKEGFSRWLDAVTRIADGAVCISRAVADELALWLEANPPSRVTPLKVGYFHLGADIASEIQDATSLTIEDERLSLIQSRPSILMVGTLEPRKGHAQALAAFERLWTHETDVNLVIVGKQGWMVEQLVEGIRQHPESGKRLFWFEGASDSLLFQLYGSSSALLAASEAEGFGLPLIEAAQHRLPIIARNLPVFREVAGEHAFYFDGSAGEDLAQALRKWLDLHAVNAAPQSHDMPWLTWTESTGQLLDAIEKQQWYKLLPSLPAR